MRLPDLPEADVLLIIPPFAQTTWPSLGVHLLQAKLAEVGGRAAVLYANLVFAAAIGEQAYVDLANAPSDWLLGDRLFGEAAFGPRPGGYLPEAARLDGDWLPPATRRLLDDADRLQRLAAELADEVAAVAVRYAVVGVTSSFDQTAAAVAIAARVKRAAPDVVTLIGGANCEGPMATGVASLSDAIDHVFSGESEQAFADWWQRRARGEPSPRIVEGAPCLDMDALPTPVYDEFFAQRQALLPDSPHGPVWIAYETSRGCWWGEKQHCTFCGLNGLGMGFRHKSADRVLAELGAMVARYPTRHVEMTDNIMPHRYHRDLVPRLAEAVPDLHVFYEQKANLTLEQVRGMHAAGILAIQPGIEALSTPLLDRMRKGIKARQNIALMRYARATGVHVRWNLLYAFPGDDLDDYRATLALVPLIVHLPPPNALVHLSIDRFSPYFNAPEAHGIRELRAIPAYAEVFPDSADLASLAYHYVGEWDTAARRDPALFQALWEAVLGWRRAWTGEQAHPSLVVMPQGPGRWMLTDTRGLGRGTTFTLNDAQADAVLVGGPRARVPAADWAIQAGFAADLDGWCVPLAITRPALLADLEARRSAEQPSRPITLLA